MTLQKTAAAEAQTSPAAGLRRRQLLLRIGVFAALLAGVIGLQWHAGAYTAEFSGYPDEASHYVSGLLVHDYARAGFPSSPIQFAEQFYLHYPYLAIGHWPPGFYALEGLWMLVFSPSKVSVMLLMALITAGLAFSTFLVVSRIWSTASGTVSAFFLISMPVVQSYAGMVMADTLLALLSFWAVIAFGEYAESGRARYAAWFAMLSTAAILTKANGFLLAGVPILTILLSRRFALLKRPSLWLSGAFVAAMCLPWHFVSMHMMLPTFTSTAGLRFLMQSSVLYGRQLTGSLGPVGIVFSVIGMAALVLRPAAEGRLAPRWAAQGAVCFSYFIFYCGIPAGIERRYLVLLLPTAVLLANAGAETIGRVFRISAKAIPAQAGVLSTAGIFFLLFSFTWPVKASYGFQQAADEIAAASPTHGAMVLVSTETALGEGIFVSEMAMRNQRGSGSTVLRGSKVLANEDWNRTRYTPLYSSAEQLRQCLNEAGPEYLVLDISSNKIYEHHRQLLEITQNHPDEWQAAGSHGNVRIFRNIRRAQAMRITTNLKGKFGTWPVVVRLACSVHTAARVH